MALEIERKFLVTGEGWRTASGTHYVQGYLCREPGRVVRVRRAGEKAYLTVKGELAGVTRKEFQYAIPPADADELLRLCEGPLIEKTRRIVMHAGKRWEVDEFHGDNAGLLLAEIELESEDEVFEKPPWAGEEVSHDLRYYNSHLTRHPFREWGAPP